MNNQKLLPPYDPDLACPLINGVEYPYSIMEAINYWSKSGARCMLGETGFDAYTRAINREKKERMTRYKFI